VRSVARIEHIALWTSDLERLAAFYSKYLGASVGPKYVNATKGFESRFLTFDNGARVELMKSSTLQPQRYAPGVQRMGLTHLAFSLGTESRVDELTGRLRTDGFAIEDGPRRTGDGYYESVVLDPDGNRIELTV
jgi:lactoylglutathione lyase